MTAVHLHHGGPGPATEAAQGSRRRPASPARRLGAAGLVALLALVFTATEGRALSCLGPSDVELALCSDGICREGLGVTYELAGNYCDSLPVTRALSEAELAAFAQTLGRSGYRDPTGVFEIVDGNVCDPDKSTPEHCEVANPITKLSAQADTPAFAARRNEWLDRERQEYLLYLSTLWLIPAIFFGVTVLVIGWPWALGAWVPGFRRFVGWSLLAAVPIQLLVGWFLLSEFWLTSMTWASMVWTVTGQLCGVVFFIALPVQLGIVVRRAFEGAGGAGGSSLTGR